MPVFSIAVAQDWGRTTGGAEAGNDVRIGLDNAGNLGRSFCNFSAFINGISNRELGAEVEHLRTEAVVRSVFRYVRAVLGDADAAFGNALRLEALNYNFAASRP